MGKGAVRDKFLVKNAREVGGCNRIKLPPSLFVEFENSWIM